MGEKNMDSSISYTCRQQNIAQQNHTTTKYARGSHYNKKCMSRAFMGIFKPSKDIYLSNEQEMIWQHII